MRTLLIASLLATPCAAQEVIPNSVDAVLAMSRDFGIANEDRPTPEGNAVINAMMDGLHYGILFYGCTNGANCDSIQFHASFLPPDDPLAFVNTWNLDKRFAAAYFRPDGIVVLNYNINVEFGVNDANLLDSFELWSILLNQFSQRLNDAALAESATDADLAVSDAPEDTAEIEDPGAETAAPEDAPIAEPEPVAVPEPETEPSIDVNGAAHEEPSQEVLEEEEAPIAEPEPIAAPEPDPEPAVEPEPAATQEPADEPVLVPAPEDETEPAMEDAQTAPSEPEGEPVQEPEPALEPLPDPEAITESEEGPDGAAVAEPEASADPEPQSVPEPEIDAEAGEEPGADVPPAPEAAEEPASEPNPSSAPTRTEPEAEAPTDPITTLEDTQIAPEDADLILDVLEGLDPEAVPDAVE